MKETQSYPLQFRGVEWRRDGDTLVKSVLRYRPGIKKLFRQRIYHVPENTVFCGHCLSIKVDFQHEAHTFRCADCGLYADAPVTPS